jgi:hypothetical protein
MRMVGLKSGTIVGLITGLAVTFFTLFAAGMLKGLITDFTGEWPDWFPGQYVDFFMSGGWIVAFLLFCTAAGAVVGFIRQRHYELL